MVAEGIWQKEAGKAGQRKEQPGLNGKVSRLGTVERRGKAGKETNDTLGDVKKQRAATGVRFS